MWQKYWIYGQHISLLQLGLKHVDVMQRFLLLFPSKTWVNYIIQRNGFFNSNKVSNKTNHDIIRVRSRHHIYIL